MGRQQVWSWQSMGGGASPVITEQSPEAQATRLRTYALQYAAPAVAVVAATPGVGQPVKPVRFPEPEFRKRQRWVRLSGEALIVVDVSGQIVNRVDLVGESLTPVDVAGLLQADRWLSAPSPDREMERNMVGAERWMAGVLWVRAGVVGQTFVGKDLAGAIEARVGGDARMSVDPAFLEWERRARAEETSVQDVVGLFRR